MVCAYLTSVVGMRWQKKEALQSLERSSSSETDPGPATWQAGSISEFSYEEVRILVWAYLGELSRILVLIIFGSGV